MRKREEKEEQKGENWAMERKDVAELARNGEIPAFSLVLTQIDFFHLFNEGRPVQVEELCRLVLDPIGSVEGLEDQFPFEFCDRRVKGYAVFRNLDSRMDRPRRQGQHFFGKVTRFDDPFTFQDHDPLDHVLQFSDISRPIIVLKQLHGFWRNSGNAMFVFCVV